MLPYGVQRAGLDWGAKWVPSLRCAKYALNVDNQQGAFSKSA